LQRKNPIVIIMIESFATCREVVPPRGFFFVMKSTCDFVVLSPSCDFIVISPSYDFVVILPSCDFVVISL
jgi:hypothetical protein